MAFGGMEVVKVLVHIHRKAPGGSTVANCAGQEDMVRHRGTGVDRATILMG